MKHSKILSALIMGGALMIPTYVVAQNAEHEKTTTTTTTTETQRYDDPDTKEYHQWSGDEDRAYRTYLQEQHRDYVEFPKATTTQQTEYWKWRHDHPDKTIMKKSETETQQQR